MVPFCNGVLRLSRDVENAGVEGDRTIKGSRRFGPLFQRPAKTGIADKILHVLLQGQGTRVSCSSDGVGSEHTSGTDDLLPT